MEEHSPDVLLDYYDNPVLVLSFMKKQLVVYVKGTGPYDVLIFWAANTFMRRHNPRVASIEGNQFELQLMCHSGDRHSTFIQVTGHPWGIASANDEPLNLMGRHEPPLISVRVWDDGYPSNGYGFIQSVSFKEEEPEM